MKKDILFSKLALYFVIFLDNFGFSVAFILFAPLVLDPDFGLMPVSMGDGTRKMMLACLFSSFPLTQFFGGPILGDIADHFGRRKALYISILGTILGYFLSGYAIAIKGFWILIITRMITGFFAGNVSICMAALADNASSEKARGRTFGFVSLALGLGWNLGMLAGGYLSNPSLSQHFTASTPFWISAIFSIISLLTVINFYKESHPTKEAFKFDLMSGGKHIVNALKVKRPRPLYFVHLLWIIGWAGLIVQWYSPYATDVLYKTLPITERTLIVSWVMMFNGTLWSIGGGVVNPLLIKKYTSEQIAITSFLISALLIASGFVAAPIVFNICYGIASLFAALVFGNVIALISSASPKDIQGKVMGIAQSMMALGLAITPYIGGAIAKRDLSLIFPIGSAVMILGTLLLIWWKCAYGKALEKK